MATDTPSSPPTPIAPPAAGQIGAFSLSSSQHINLKLLQAFLLVAKWSSFKDAADELCRTQAAVSAQVKKLESQLRVKLFHRTTRKVSLTTEGELLLEYTRRGIGEIEEGLRTVSQHIGPPHGNVAIACSPTLVATHLPPILSAFERDFPDIVLSLMELKSVQLLNAVRNDEIDFAIGPDTDSDEFDFEPLFSEQIYLLVQRRLMPGRRRGIALSELSDLPIIQFYNNTVLGRMITKTARQLNVSLNVRYHCIQGQTLVTFSEAGLGGALVVESLLASSSAPHMLKLPIVNPEMHQRFGVIRKKGTRLSGPAMRLLDLLIRTAHAA